MPRILLACLLTLAFAATAVAATKNGVTPLSPKAGSTVAVGSTPTFKIRSTGPGTVWVHVCKAAKKDKEGLICHEESIGQAKKRKGVFQYKVKFFDYPDFWLNTAGTYYWQAHRIDCTGNTNDCRREGPVVKFKVR
jgi:hypothetical protein